MPTFTLSSLEKQKLGRFDVVGKHSAGSSGFVAHVALHNADGCEINYDQIVDVVHMGPPLENDRRMNAHVAGQVPLTTDEITRIEAWIEKIVDEYQREKAGRRRQYTIDPPWEDYRDPNTGVRRYRRFSCAGFVLKAHSQVDIELLRIDKQALPKVDKQLVAAAYPDAARNPDRLQRFGIQGDGPWRIVLAGYVLHALNRTSEEIRQGPYQAQPGNERF